MKCSEIRELLSLYIDNMLEESLIDEVAAHIAACPECKREYEKQSTQLKIMELSLSRVSDSDARTAVKQFYFERVPLKSMRDSNG